MDTVKVEEPRVQDPSVNIEPDLRLTMKEWVLYWKVRYEGMLEKVQAAAKFIEGMRDQMKALQATNVKLQQRIDEMQAQYSAEVRERQAKQTDGKPELKAVESEEPKKAFKRKKRA
jgi:hypothetical protein